MVANNTGADPAVFPRPVVLEVFTGVPRLAHVIADFAGGWVRITIEVAQHIDWKVGGNGEALSEPFDVVTVFSIVTQGREIGLGGSILAVAVHEVSAVNNTQRIGE